jgi:hypothetical protein
MEEKVAQLEKANFDLRMKIFYLNEKLAESQVNGQMEDAAADKVINLLQQRDVAADKLKAQLAAQQQRIVELEEELVMVQKRLENEIKVRDSTIEKSNQSTILKVEETLRRERQAALAVAQHDAATILRLEGEVKKFKELYEADQQLLAEATEKCAKLVTTVGERDRDIEIKTKLLDECKKECEELKKKVESNAEVITDLSTKLYYGQTAVSTAKPSNPYHNMSFNSSFGAPPTPWSTVMPRAAAERMHGTSNVNPATMSPGIGSGTWAQAGVSNPASPTKSGSMDGSSASPRPAPRLGVPALMGGNNAIAKEGDLQQWQTPGAQTSSINRFSMDAVRANPAFQSAFRPSHPQYQDSSQDFGNVSMVPQQLSIPRGASGQYGNMHMVNELQSKYTALEEECNRVRDENVALKLQLDHERTAVKNLEGLIQTVKTTADEITLLEAEEIIRLEGEMDRLVKEKTRIEDTVKQQKETAEKLRSRILQLESIIKTMEAERGHGNNRSRNADLYIESDIGRRSSDSTFRSTGSYYSSKTPGSRSSGRVGGATPLEDVDGSAARSFGGHGDKYLPPSMSAEYDSFRRQQESMTTMFRCVILTHFVGLPC